MRSLKTIIATIFSVFIFNCVHAQIESSKKLIEKENPNQSLSIQLSDPVEIIQSYVSDYKNDRFAAYTMMFGIEVPDYGSWTVHVTGNKIQSEWEVLMDIGLPQKPTFVYIIEYETLKAIHEGAINALTAQGKAFSGDYTPMSIKQMEGYEPSMEEYAKINPFSFHFWTRGFPEIIPFSEGMTRKAHGSNFTVFYYETGLRTAWYRVLPEERVRDDAREQAAPFPMLIVAIEGTTEGEVDGQRVSLTKGNTIFIPAGVAHKWWNETNNATEAILIMFGKGA
jgi:mannose-6-phosphate isomerase-like protein (cupin superfamily)